MWKGREPSEIWKEEAAKRPCFYVREYLDYIEVGKCYKNFRADNTVVVDSYDDMVREVGALMADPYKVRIDRVGLVGDPAYSQLREWVKAHFPKVKTP